MRRSAEGVGCEGRLAVRRGDGEVGRSLKSLFVRAFLGVSMRTSAGDLGGHGTISVGAGSCAEAWRLGYVDELGDCIGRGGIPLLAMRRRGWRGRSDIN